MAKLYAREFRAIRKLLKKKRRSFKSPHEALSRIQEEVLELQSEVFRRSKKRSVKRMRREALEVAAMALRFASEVKE